MESACFEYVVKERELRYASGDNVGFHEWDRIVCKMIVDAIRIK